MSMYTKQYDAHDETKISHAICVMEITADLLSESLQKHPSYARDLIGAWSDFKICFAEPRRVECEMKIRR